jgi:hypothetical protein
LGLKKLLGGNWFQGYNSSQAVVGENQGLDGPLLGNPAIGDNSCWETMVALEEGAYPTVVPRNEISTTNASEYTHIKNKIKQYRLSPHHSPISFMLLPCLSSTHLSCQKIPQQLYTHQGNSLADLQLECPNRQAFVDCVVIN